MGHGTGRIGFDLILPTRHGFLKNGKLAVGGKFIEGLPVREDEAALYTLKQVGFGVFGCMMVIEGDSV